MAYLDSKSHFALPNRVRTWLRDRNDSPGTTNTGHAALSWQQLVYNEVGDFLRANRLDPTPDNYDLAYQFRAAANAQLVAAVHEEIARSGSLDIDSAERIFAESGNTISGNGMADFVRQVEEQAVGLSSIAQQSGRDAVDFRSALENECSNGSDTASVIKLTKAMVTRTRLAEAQLRDAQKELTGLRTTLIEAQRAADVDPLTELPNRRAFKRGLEKLIETAVTKKTPMSLAFCDIDHFKQFNDKHGHETGDRVLRYVASTLAREFENNALVGRFGGEEFVIALAGSTLADAKHAVDGARARLSERNLLTADNNLELGVVTFSAGVTTLAEGDGSADLLKRADDALYRAKGSGRNCVMIG